MIQTQQHDIPGLVIKTHSGFYTVKISIQTTNQTDPQDGIQTVICQLRGTLKQASRKTELCVIGDHVIIDILDDGSGMIKTILPRVRVLSRVEPSEYAGTSTEREQVMIANPDQAVFVYAAANPAPHTRMLDRCLVAAEKATIPTIAVVVNKIDLAEAEARATFAVYERIGYPLLYVSAEKQRGIEALRQLLTGKISIFTGPSGVGKSSLLNAIQPGLGQAVGRVSTKLTKGKHTTVNAEMFPLVGGGYIADTPGIRGLLPWDVEPSELDGYFREFRAYVPDCQFSDCTHTTEPGCAIRAAVNLGDISAERYDSYLKLREQLDEQYVY